MTEPAAVAGRGWTTSESGSAGSETKGGRAPRSQFGDAQEPPKQRAAIIVNPTKFHSPERVKDTLTTICLSKGWEAPLWLETTAEDPGAGQTQEAIAAEVDVVCALGGDGTVRTVGAELVDTGVPMGLLPGGTGNLLARNLDLPAEDISKAMKIVLSGRNQRIDSVTATITQPAEEVDESAEESEASTSAPLGETKTSEHIFFVMAGMGFDAEVMAGVEEDLKDKVGWLAYVVSGAKNLKGASFSADLTCEDGTKVHRKMRTIIIGNVGKLQGGVVLLPEAASDNGRLDAIVLAPKGVSEWATVATQIATRHKYGHDRVERFNSERFLVKTGKPVQVQLDGDTLGQAIELDVKVNPASLVVRLPA
ncbi:diacylglycerol kinase family lipid kinase [Ornithinimicrobium sp. Arc0846-15]|nr:diacylglycerol kinase family lipid kinase [Ornithinimicrobium laminariae]